MRIVEAAPDNTECQQKQHGGQQTPEQAKHIPTDQNASTGNNNFRGSPGRKCHFIKAHFRAERACICNSHRFCVKVWCSAHSCRRTVYGAIFCVRPPRGRAALPAIVFMFVGRAALHMHIVDMHIRRGFCWCAHLHVNLAECLLRLFLLVLLARPAVSVVVHVVDVGFYGIACGCQWILCCAYTFASNHQHSRKHTHTQAVCNVIEGRIPCRSIINTVSVHGWNGKQIV